MKTIKTRGWILLTPVLSALLMVPVMMTGTAQAETLRDVVSMALKTNPEVLIRTSGADAQTDAVRQAQAGYLPSVNLTAGVGYENSRNATTVGAYRSGANRYKDQSRTRALPTSCSFFITSV